MRAEGSDCQFEKPSNGEQALATAPLRHVLEEQSESL